MSHQLRIEHLHKSFGLTKVLTELDLTVERGELVAVLGPSGCGKTTLLRIVAGFETLDSGTVTIGGLTAAAPGRHVAPERRRIGIVPQEGALFPHLSVARNVGFGLAGDGAQRRARVGEVLEMVGLAGYERRMPHALSGGQQQRVALARALAPRPALVLLDEPFTALDASLRAAVRTDVQAALRETGATALLVTHDQQEALSMADTVAVMRSGRIVQAGTPAAVYTSPADLGVATFVGEALELDAELRDGLAVCALGRLPVQAPPGDSTPREAARGTVALRPEQVVLGSPDGDGVVARVVHVEFYGHDAMVSLTLDGLPTPLRARAQGPVALRPGEQVGLTATGTVLFFPKAPEAA